MSGLISPISLTTPLPRILALLTGILSHLLLFTHGEWDVQAFNLLSFFSISDVSIAFLLHHHYPATYATFGSALSPVLQLTGFLVAGIFSSVLVYRAFFHRLNIFPGPWGARLSNFYVSGLAFKKVRLFEEIARLHGEYGDYVRIAPSELSINDPAAVDAIHGPGSKCVKGPWYNVLHPRVSLQMIRNKPEHVKRRKAWDRGFNAKSLRGYEPRVTKYTTQLVEQVQSTSGKPIDMSKWFNFYSFDIMGDMAFGQSFDMMKNGIVHYFMSNLHANMANIGLFSHLMWLFPIFKATPILNASEKKFEKWMRGVVEDRKKMKLDVPDVFHWLLEDYDAIEKPTYQDKINLEADAGLIAVAGSDTTAASLTCLFFELARHPPVLKALQSEIDKTFSSASTEEEVDAIALAKLPYLEAVINETMRLHPPVPGGVQRMTPKEGLWIGKTFIPGETILQVPSWTMFRNPRCFVRPNEFIPERWTSKKELTIDSSVFHPFSVGRYSCVGKQLGLMEIRNVTAQLVRRFNVQFAEEQDQDVFLKGAKDTFTLTLPTLKLVLPERKN